MQKQQPTNDASNYATPDYLNHVAKKLREATGQGGGAFPLVGEWVFGGKVTDNDADVTRNSLLGAWDGSTGIADAVIREQLESTGANPKYSIFATGLVIELFPAAETQSILRQIRAAGFLSHKPAEDAGGRNQVFRFADYMDSPVTAVASGATAEVTAVTIARKPPTKACVPFLLNLERDTFTSSSTVAVNAAADFLFLVRVQGILAPNNILNRATIAKVISSCR